MENWALRRQQVRGIVGTNDAGRLSAALASAREFVAAQPAAADGRWEFVGPSGVSGRVTALAIDPLATMTLYAGSAAGGVFKSTNGGDSWTPLWTRSQASLAIGGLGLCTAHPRVIYAATGEWEGKISSTTFHHFAGVGVYVTHDGGETWSGPLTLSTDDRRASRWTSAVAVHPTEPGVAFVAGDRALHRSVDFGITWEEVLIPTVNETGTPLPGDMVVEGALTDVVIDADSPNIVYAAAHGVGVYRSDDGGRAQSFNALKLPRTGAATLESPKVALGPRLAGSRLVAVLTSGQLFTSHDNGDTFRASPNAIVNDPAKTFYRWCTTLAVHPTRPGLILAGHGWLWRTLDAGLTPWQRHSAQPLEDGFTHSDIQAIVFVPGQPNQVYVATDGGVYRTRDVTAPLPARGGIWKHCSSGLDVTQCYTVAVKPTRPLRIGVTSQDLGAYVYQGGDDDTIEPGREWKEVHHWEGGWIEFDPGERNAFYLDTRKGSGEDPDWLRHWADDGHGWVSPGFPDVGGKRFQSDCTIREAMAIAARRPERRMLIAKLHDAAATDDFQLYSSTAAGATWEMTAEVTKPAAVELSSDGERAYAGGKAGELWSWAGGPWRRLQLDRPLPALPINDIEVSPTDSRLIYVALGGADIASGTSQGVIFPMDVQAVWRIRVGDGDRAAAEPVSGTGAGALPPHLPITGIEIDPRHPERLFAAHLTGVHRSLDGGLSWAPLIENLPNTFVADLDLHESSRTLYAATMGRGVFRLRLPD